MHLKPGKKTDAKIAKQLRTPQCISSTHFMPISHTPGVGPSPKSVQTPHLGASYVAVVGNIFVVNICVYTTFLNTKCTTYAQGHTHYLSGGPSLLWGGVGQIAGNTQSAHWTLENSREHTKSTESSSVNVRCPENILDF